MSLADRLYSAPAAVDFVGGRRLWFVLSGTFAVISIASLLTLGLHLGVEFKGGSVLQFHAPHATTAEVARTVQHAVGGNPIAQRTGIGWRVVTDPLDPAQATHVQDALHRTFHLGGPDDISLETVGPSWGSDVSTKAVQGLVAFLVLVAAYLCVAFGGWMAVAAMVALIHDVLITAGVYSLSGLEVTPASVVGLLTILGYSLYDTVVVFDKIRENTAETGAAGEYRGAANLALNQTLIRSFNTTLIALLPVAGLLFIGAGVLQAGTLKDLALVLFVGIFVGAYSSLCIATPTLVALRR